MANEDEIIQQFKVIDSGATAALGAIDAKIQQVKTSTTSLSAAHQNHGNTIKHVGEHAQHLGGHLNHTRHQMMLFSEATGASRQGLMTMMHSMHSIGGSVGIAVGAFIILKEAVSTYREELKKAQEQRVEFNHGVRELKESVSGSGYEGKAEKINSKITSVKDQMEERAKKIEDTHSWYGVESAENTQLRRQQEQQKKTLSALFQYRDFYNEKENKERTLKEGVTERQKTEGPINTGQDRAGELKAKIEEAKSEADFSKEIL